MNTTRDPREALSRALADARQLADLGVPIITGPLSTDGDPTGPRWNRWEQTRASRLPVDRYRTGEAMGAVCGVRYDVLDIDPRNGGDASFKALSERLGDDGPEVYWEVATPSGGRHLYIAPLGIGKHVGFMRGLDLQAERSFVFLPPTVRPNKATGQPAAYRALTTLKPANGKDLTGGALRDFITERLAARAAGNGHARSALTELEQACIDAGDGEQRTALLALVTELSRKFDDDDYVLYRVMKVVGRMKAYRPRRPWTEKDVRGLLYKGGRRPLADATGAELEDLMALRDGGPMVAAAAGGLKRLSTVERKVTRWIWKHKLAIGDATLVDARAGMSKSTVSLDVVARYTRGRGMPCEPEVLAPAGNALVLAPEDREEVILARVEAAGGDPSRVYVPQIELRATGKRGKEQAYFGGHIISFPENVDRLHRWIREYQIGLMIVDPIAAFLGEKIMPNSDPSVRRALEPLVIILGQEECGAWLIRHFNKDEKQSAASRGGGSVAFAAVARTHMIAGEVPESYGSEATHAVAVVKSNNVRLRKGTALGYRIVDSDLALDDQGTMVPRVEWVGEVKIDADVLANGEKARKGPEPTTQPGWRQLLEEAFREKDAWLVADLQKRAEQAGLAWDHKVFDKVTPEFGIRKFRTDGRWYWTTRKARVTGLEVKRAQRG